ncbi:DUF2523 domain-containing protein [Paraburkholderia acidipaludis]|uniref:DUF2523 domain-containing protein n=1 Tax=Paraburkholderia acidipaludis TaxID=660537 RepID=UPI000482C9B6|nr:DUF2523 domain-containing protein [Paraburkholderia acidipaludis]
MTWAAWLLALVQPLIVQALVALGVGVLTVSGIDVAVNQAMSWCTSAVGGIPSDMLNVMALGGLFQGMSYIGGAISARIAMAGVAGVLKKFFLE